jgi:hypothetical protein
MTRLRSRLTYANVISTICLFVVLGGGAYAATSLPKNSVGTAQLKAKAVTAAKVKNNSLTGAQIQAGTLGTVPKAATAETAISATHATTADSAKRADSATTAGHAATADLATFAEDAGTLEGHGVKDFYPGSLVQRVEATPSYNGITETIYFANGLRLFASCQEGGVAGSAVLSIKASGTGSGARADAGYVEGSGGTEKPVVHEATLGPSTQTEVWTIAAGPAGSAEGVGTLVYTDTERAIYLSLATRVTTGRECVIDGTAAAVDR